MNELGIYVHIPFCKDKCYYCDFISFKNIEQKADEYVKCLIKEIESQNWDEINKTYKITTIYIGGGTPSYIDYKHIVRILEILKNNLKNGKENNNCEITIEVNPGTVNEEKLLAYKQAGVNRLSIGLQTTNNTLLRKIGRIHTYEQFLDTYKLASKVGFNNINVDLMLALPNQTIEDLKNSLEEVIKLNPNHISVYSLILEEGTKFYDLAQKGELNLPDDDLERRMYWYVKNKLELSGYIHYEISNFAKKDKESKHNLNCWNQEEYLGFGLSAHSYIDSKFFSDMIKLEDEAIDYKISNFYIKDLENFDIKDLERIEKLKKSIRVRYSNTQKLEKYIKNISKQEIQKNIELQEIQSAEEQKKEYMLLGLRKIEGVSISKFKERFTENPIYMFRNELQRLTEQKFIEIDGDYIKLTNKGLDFANLVWEEFV